VQASELPEAAAAVELPPGPPKAGPLARLARSLSLVLVAFLVLLGIRAIPIATGLAFNTLSGHATPKAPVQVAATADLSNGTLIVPVAFTALLPIPTATPGVVIKATARTTQVPSSTLSLTVALQPVTTITVVPASTCVSELKFDALAAQLGENHPMLEMARQECLAVAKEPGADVTGDGVPDELFTASHFPCGSCGFRSIFVFSGRRLVLRDGGAAAKVEPLADGTGVEVAKSYYLPGEPMCCPTHEEITRYVWNGSGFTKHDSVLLELTPATGG
jgi:hypothetical protein